MNAFLLLALQQFDGGEPLVWQGGNKVFVVEVRFEATKGKKVGPGRWGF
jgi:hypothetical protein